MQYVSRIGLKLQCLRQVTNSLDYRVGYMDMIYKSRLTWAVCTFNQPDNLVWDNMKQFTVDLLKTIDSLAVVKIRSISTAYPYTTRQNIILHKTDGKWNFRNQSIIKKLFKIKQYKHQWNCMAFQASASYGYIQQKRVSQSIAALVKDKQGKTFWLNIQL